MSINFKSLEIFDKVTGIAKVSEDSVFEISTESSSYSIALNTPRLTVEDIRHFCNICTDHIIYIPFVVQIRCPTVQDTDNLMCFDYETNTKLVDMSWWRHGDLFFVCGRIKHYLRIRAGLETPSDDLIHEAIGYLKKYFGNKAFIKSGLRNTSVSIANSLKFYCANEPISQDDLHVGIDQKTFGQCFTTYEEMHSVLKTYFKVYDEIFPPAPRQYSNDNEFWRK